MAFLVLATSNGYARLCKRYGPVGGGDLKQAIRYDDSDSGKLKAENDGKYLLDKMSKVTMYRVSFPNDTQHWDALETFIRPCERNSNYVRHIPPSGIEARYVRSE